MHVPTPESGEKCNKGARDMTFEERSHLKVGLSILQNRPYKPVINNKLRCLQKHLSHRTLDFEYILYSWLLVSYRPVANISDPISGVSYILS